jgi:hypothetical protein
MSQRTKSHTLPSRASRHTSHNLAKSVLFPTQEEIQFFFSFPLEKIKTPDTQTDTTKTVELNNDNGLQTQTTEHQLPTAVLQKWRCSASYDSFVVGSSSVLRLKFSGKIRHLRKAAGRCTQQQVM